MDLLTLLPLRSVTSTTIVISTLLVALVTVLHKCHKFFARISPGIPYAGGESLLSRLRVPAEYGKDPVGFLVKTRDEIGDVFCVDLFLVKFVFFLGGENNKMVFRSHEDDLSFWDVQRFMMGPQFCKSASMISLSMSSGS